MAMQPPLWTLSEAARELGTDIRTISGLVRAHKMATCPVPRNGKGKGLNPAQMERLRVALGCPAGGSRFAEMSA